MMMMENEFHDRNNLNINDIDLSLLRLSSPPFDYSRSSSFLSAASPDIISPLKRSSPVSDESDQPKRRRISLQDPIFITYPETHSSSIDDPSHQASPVPEKQETSPYDSKSHGTEKQRMKTVLNNHVETNYDTYEEINREETNYDETQQEEEEEEGCGEGMRIERSGEGFVIRLKCRCKLAYRVLFSDHHFYFKSL